jgi:hypothetical protein
MTDKPVPFAVTPTQHSPWAVGLAQAASDAAVACGVSWAAGGGFWCFLAASMFLNLVRESRRRMKAERLAAGITMAIRDERHRMGGGK